MESRTNTVTNASDHPTEAISNPHGHENPMGANVDVGEVYDFYKPYDPMEANADLDDIFSTRDQIDGIADRVIFGNGAQEYLSVPLHPTAELPESAEYTIADADAIINNPIQMDESPGVAATHTNLPLLDLVAHTYQSAELVTTELHAMVSIWIQMDGGPGGDPISSNPHPKSSLQWAPVAGSLRSVEHATADLYAAFNNPHHTDGNLDVDATYSNAHPYHPSLPLDPINEALMINAGDASQTSHNRSRTHALLTQTHAEPPSSNTQFTCPVGTLSSGSSPGMDRPHTGNPGHKRRRTTDGESSYTDPAGRLSSSMIHTDRTSTSTDRTSTSSTSVAPTPTDRELAFCPMCNMGDGKFGCLNNETLAGTPGSIGQSTPKWKPDGPYFVVTNRTTAPITFKKHMKMIHKKLFYRIFCSDFVCGFCACGGAPVCVTRFCDLDSLLEHVWEFHKHASLDHDWYLHYCDSVCSPTSFDPQLIHDTAVQLAGPTL